MGMTIDEHITQLKKLKSFHNGSYGANINFAIDTICKYQKIKEKGITMTTFISVISFIISINALIIAIIKR